MSDANLPTISGFTQDVADTSHRLSGRHSLRLVDCEQTAERLHIEQDVSLCMSD